MVSFILFFSSSAFLCACMFTYEPCALTDEVNENLCRATGGLQSLIQHLPSTCKAGQSVRALVKRSWQSLDAYELFALLWPSKVLQHKCKRVRSYCIVSKQWCAFMPMRPPPPARALRSPLLLALALALLQRGSLTLGALHERNANPTRLIRLLFPS